MSPPPTVRRVPVGTDPVAAPPDLLAEIADAGPAALAASAAATAPLTLIGNNGDNAITVSRTVFGQIIATVPVAGTPTVANTDTVQVFGLGGNDTIRIDEANGAMPRASLFGGSGDDTATGGSGADMLFGQDGNDALFGKGGVDVLFGGNGNDTLTGGDGNDQMFGEAGNDRFVWNQGDDNDLFEGGDGNDTAEINTGNGSESLTVSSLGPRLHVDRGGFSPFSIDVGTTEAVILNTFGGNDVIDASAMLTGPAQLVIDAGLGNDTLTGGGGNDVLVGGEGDDLLRGDGGDDFAVLGAGNDTFAWSPGDGDDILEGQGGIDTLRLDGSGADEMFDLTASGARVRLLRDVDGVLLDMSDVEVIDLAASGGADRISVTDLSGTAVTSLRVNLAGAPSDASGDGRADQVLVGGTAAGDTVTVVKAGGSAFVSGLQAAVSVSGADRAGDTLTVDGGAGDDVIRDASAVAASAGIALSFVGGAGNDVLLGGAGTNILLGGAGDDTLVGGGGFDRFLFQGQNGTDVVTDFTAGLDRIQVTGYGDALDSFADLSGAIVQAGSSTLVELGAVVAGAGTIVLSNEQAKQLGAADFLFG